MKNFPLLPASAKTYIAWTETYLTTLDEEVFSLYNYINFSIPDFYEQTLVPDNDTYNVSELNYRGYWRAPGEVQAIVTNGDAKTISPGTLVLSLAKAENQKETPDAVLKKDWNNYLIQPFGFAAFYMLSSAKWPISNWTFYTYAEELFGLKILFGLQFYNTRYFLHQPMSFGEQKEIAIMSCNTESEPIIADSVGCLWSELDRPPMSFLYREDDGKREEIIVDHSIKITTKVAETNIAVYTIKASEDLLPLREVFVEVL